MFPKLEHAWNLTPEEATALQNQWASKVVKSDQFPKDYATIGGVDLHYLKNSDKVVACVVVLQRETLKVIDSAVVEERNIFPYIPGLFSFREIPSITKAMAKLTIQPDLLVCDGQGFAHPRRFGLACHLGVLFDIPTIGCGKSRFIGDYCAPGSQRGDWSQLMDQNEVIGNVLRTQDGVKPIFVSIGHRISLQSATEIVLSLATAYRLPETTRMADQMARGHISCKS